MSYSENPVTANERSALQKLSWPGLVDALIALIWRVAGGDGLVPWLFTIFAASLLLSQVLNYRARDEYFDTLVLAGARWALGLMAAWIIIVTMVAQFTHATSFGPSLLLTDQMITLCAVMSAYFAGFCFKRWRSA